MGLAEALVGGEMLLDVPEGNFNSTKTEDGRSRLAAAKGDVPGFNRENPPDALKVGGVIASYFRWWAPEPHDVGAWVYEEFLTEQGTQIVILDE